ncbi:hypothetical protein [Massilia endophytica]|uniref:hypothetical protein n=1 Tax=Massilia endophytica TaxID=2899220 RepID=UPI001E4A8937|nr:hypothetical protein [Massilia endophytica]UGQ44991.1 hypothetical protein LSQ66_14415 [Massilia endophytica]
MKQTAVRQVKSSFTMADLVGNALVVKFTYTDNKASSVIFPGSIVLWLLRHIPVNQNPDLKQPPEPQPLFREEWDDAVTPRVLSVQCKQFEDGVRMNLELNRKPDLSLLLDAGNLELIRQVFGMYANELVNIDGL